MITATRCATICLLLAASSLVQASAVHPDGVHVTAVSATSAPFDLALISAASPMEQLRDSKTLVRTFPLGSSFALVAQGSDGAHVSLVIEVIKDGQRVHRVEAKGFRVSGTVSGTEPPRVTAF
jgi:hypothetical protein